MEHKLMSDFQAVPRPFELSEDACYLVIGGVGGLGRAIVSWMIRHGARNIIIASRSAGKDGARAVDLEECGARVHTLSSDITDEEQLCSLIARCSKTLPPIRGIIHSAMLLCPALIKDITLEDWNQSLFVKVTGILNLHAQLPKDLDFWIMLSSVSGILGPTGQAGYAAANSFLDAFAAYRNHLGLPGVALDLGRISNIGFLASHPDVEEMMSRQGFVANTEQQLLTMIRYGMRKPCHSDDFGQVISGLGNWESGVSPSSLARSPFVHFRRITTSDERQQQPVSSDTVKDLRSLPFSDGVERVSSEIRNKVAALCMIPAEDVTASKSLTQYGVDSLVAVEMRNWIFRRFEHTVPLLQLMGADSLATLSLKICQSFA